MDLGLDLSSGDKKKAFDEFLSDRKSTKFLEILTGLKSNGDDMNKRDLLILTVKWFKESKGACIAGADKRRFLNDTLASAVDEARKRNEMAERIQRERLKKIEKEKKDAGDAKKMLQRAISADMELSAVIDGIDESKKRGGFYVVVRGGGGGGEGRRVKCSYESRSLSEGIFELSSSHEGFTSIVEGNTIDIELLTTSWNMDMVNKDYSTKSETLIKDLVVPTLSPEFRRRNKRGRDQNSPRQPRYVCSSVMSTSDDAFDVVFWWDTRGRLDPGETNMRLKEIRIIRVSKDVSTDPVVRYRQSLEDDLNNHTKQLDMLDKEREISHCMLKRAISEGLLRLAAKQKMMELHREACGALQSDAKLLKEDAYYYVCMKNDWVLLPTGILSCKSYSSLSSKYTYMRISPECEDMLATLYIAIKNSLICEGTLADYDGCYKKLVEYARAGF